MWLCSLVLSLILDGYVCVDSRSQAHFTLFQGQQHHSVPRRICEGPPGGPCCKTASPSAPQLPLIPAPLGPLHLALNHRARLRRNACKLVLYYYNYACDRLIQEDSPLAG